MTRVTTIVLGVVLCALAVALLVARASLIPNININWDEFHFLGQVHAYLRGDLVARVLTFHVHLFSWVPALSENEALQVLSIRAVMFVASIVSAACVALVAWRLFRSVNAALFSVVAAQSTAYVLHHGSAARFDPLASMFFAIAAALLASVHFREDDMAVRGRRVRVGLAGVAFALAALVTIKSFLVFLPALTAVVVAGAWTSSSAQRIRTALVDLAVLGGSAALSFGALFLWHASTLGPAKAIAVEAEAQITAPARPRGASLAELVERQLPGDVLPEAEYLVESLQWDWPFWLLLIAGFALAFTDIGAGGARRRNGVRALVVLLPLSVVTVYRNSFSYFYVCVLPFAALLPALVAAKLERATRARPIVGAVLVAALGALAASRAAYWIGFNGDDQVSKQAVTIDVVHEVFPEPAPYVDRCDMIAGYKKVGPFMSTWVIEDYRRRGAPIMRDLLEQERPRFLLANVDSLALDAGYSGKDPRRLLKEDFTVLRDSFIPHWGPLWVAGRIVDLDGQHEVTLSLVIADRYVVEWSGDAAAVLTVDGTPTKPGDAIELSAGDHVVTATAAGTLTLRTSSARPAPLDLEPVDVFADDALFQPLRFRTSSR